jgi:hypothetical protein
MEDQRDWRVRSALMMIAGLDPSGRTADIHFRHELLASILVTGDWRCEGTSQVKWEAPNAAAKLDSAAPETYTF